MRKYTINYTDLVFNTLLDVSKRKNRRTIDEKDITNFERILSEISLENDIDLNVSFSEDRETFKSRIDKYTYMKEDQKLGVTYTLYPWIDNDELEHELEYSIFVSMEPVYAVTRDKLRLARNTLEEHNLNQISEKVNNHYLQVVKSRISELEKEKEIKLKQLQKIKQNLQTR